MELLTFVGCVIGLFVIGVLMLLVLACLGAEMIKQLLDKQSESDTKHNVNCFATGCRHHAKDSADCNYKTVELSSTGVCLCYESKKGGGKC